MPEAKQLSERCGSSPGPGQHVLSAKHDLARTAARLCTDGGGMHACMGLLHPRAWTCMQHAPAEQHMPHGPHSTHMMSPLKQWVHVGCCPLQQAPLCVGRQPRQLQTPNTQRTSPRLVSRSNSSSYFLPLMTLTAEGSTGLAGLPGCPAGCSVASSPSATATAPSATASDGGALTFFFFFFSTPFKSFRVSPPVADGGQRVRLPHGLAWCLPCHLPPRHHSSDSPLNTSMPPGGILLRAGPA